MNRKFRALVVTLPLLLGCDLWSKSAARGLPLGEQVPVWEGWLAWTHAENPWIAFSLPIPMAVVVGVGLVLVAWLAVELHRLPGNATLRGAGLAAMLAGAIGNLVDRLQDGTVTDMVMIYTEHATLAPWLRDTFGTSAWPIFNVADVALLLGVLLWLAGAAFEDDAPEPLWNEEGETA